MLRRLRLKLKRQGTFYIKVFVVFFIVAFIFDKLVIEKKLFRRRAIEVRKDLLNYNEDGLRRGWPFQISKHYDVYDLRSYTSKPRILATSDLPGEGGTTVVLSKVLDDVAIWSVFNRTPTDLLVEIILVDDFSDKLHLKDPLDDYLAENFAGKVKLIRTEQREGIARARLIGAKEAQGQVIVFLDATIEVNDDWLEPLLSRIASDRSVIATPRIDHISHFNMTYIQANRTVYGLGWNQFHYEFPQPEREIHRNHENEWAPLRSPALVGTAIAVDREFFFEIGSFDKVMTIWGGENSEFSLRVWQCGGAIEMVPCSRIGHFFRLLPYSFNAENDEEIKLRNTIRVAEVWMDEYIPYFNIIIPPHSKRVKGGDVSELVALRNKFKCKGFHWYLKNVFPESVMSVGFHKIGQIQRIGSKFCLDRLGRNNNRQIGIYQCHGHGYSQGFAYQKNKQIVFHHSKCLGLAQKENITAPVTLNATLLNDPNLLTPDMNTTNHVVLLSCNSTNGEKWNYDETKNQIVHLETGMCLATELWMVVVSPCDLQDERQKWLFSSFDEYKRKLLNDANNMNRGNP